MTETIILKPEDRRAYIPSDVMSLGQYNDFKIRFNADLPTKNQKIKVGNETAKLNNQPLVPELKEYPLETVTMLAPRQLIITLEDYKRILIPKGLFQMPVELADHWYLKPNGIEKYDMPPVPVSAKSKEPVKDNKLDLGLKKGK